jgi:MoaA/NifB/PqqE/SkfB family radical SAM enzyme
MAGAMYTSRLVVVWRVTARCNLACPFCAYDRTLDIPRPSAEEAEVSRFGALLADHSRALGRSALVSWLGGEPLLWPPLPAVSSALRAEGIGIGITTNGLGLDAPRRRAWAMETLDELTVSLDGLADYHDRVRRSPGGHAQILRAVEALADGKRREGRGPLLRVNTILMRENVADFPALCEVLALAGVEEITFNQLGGNDRPEFYPDHRLLPEQVDDFCRELPALKDRLGARGVTLRGGDAYLARLRATARGQALPVDDCGPGQAFWFVDEAGRVSPCSFTSAAYGVPLFSLRAPADLAALPARWAAMRAGRRAAPCLDCHSTQVFEKFQGDEGERPGA